MIALPAAISLSIVVLVIAFFVGRTMRPAGLPHSEAEKQRLIAAAEVEAESLKRQAALDAKELGAKARAEIDAELKARQTELERQVRETSERERELERQERQLKQRLDETARSEKQLAGREAAAEAAARTAAAQAVEARARLEKIAGLSAAEAKARLFDEVRDEARRAAADEVRKIEEAARAEADEKSRMVISVAAAWPLAHPAGAAAVVAGQAETVLGFCVFRASAPLHEAARVRQRGLERDRDADLVFVSADPPRFRDPGMPVQIEVLEHLGVVDEIDEPPLAGLGSVAAPG